MTSTDDNETGVASKSNRIQVFESSNESAAKQNFCIRVIHRVHLRCDFPIRRLHARALCFVREVAIKKHFHASEGMVRFFPDVFPLHRCDQYLITRFQNFFTQIYTLWVEFTVGSSVRISPGCDGSRTFHSMRRIAYEGLLSLSVAFQPSARDCARMSCFCSDASRVSIDTIRRVHAAGVLRLEWNCDERTDALCGFQVCRRRCSREYRACVGRASASDTATRF